MIPDYYKVLQVDPQAEPEVIEAAYKRLAAKYHPDHDPSPFADERMKELNEAYEVLRDPERRARYDAAARAGRPAGDGRGADRGSFRPGRYLVPMAGVAALYLLMRVQPRVGLVAAALLALYLLVRAFRRR